MPPFLRDLLRAFLYASAIPAVIGPAAFAFGFGPSLEEQQAAWRASVAAYQQRVSEVGVNQAQREDAIMARAAAEQRALSIQLQRAPQPQLMATPPAPSNDLLPMRKPLPPAAVAATASPPFRCAVPLEEILPELLFSTFTPAQVGAVVRTACPAS
jgi:hypothetical protein